MGNLCGSQKKDPFQDDCGFSNSDYADIFAQITAQESMVAARKVERMERALPPPTDRATRLTCWLSSRLAGGFSGKADRLNWRILYHVHWQQDIAPVHAQWLDVHLPPVLAQCVLEYEAIPSKDPARSFVCAGKMLLTLSPLNETEQALLRTLHARELNRMQHVEKLIDAILPDNESNQIELHAVDFYSIIEQMCENLEPFQLEDDADASRLVWHYIQQRLSQVASKLRARLQTLSPTQRDEWNACHRACFSNLSSRFPKLSRAEQVVVEELLTA
jgi:two-component sensor histidine kinase